jgi:hypothetical protein
VTPVLNDRDPISPLGPRRPLITPAHLPAVLLGALLLMALALGIGEGHIGPKTFEQPASSPSDPITVP